ncbi:MAG: PDZ domain-containing protein [Vicinamibacterales bacterium]
MRQSRFMVFGGVLAIGVALSVGSLLAQSQAAPEPAGRQVRILDGRGSGIGVTIRDIGPADHQGDGIVVEDVVPDGPADKAGIHDGDIVVEFDGERVRSARQFSRLVRETPDGRQVPVAVLREGQRQALTVVPEADAAVWFGEVPGAWQERLQALEPRLREIEPRLRELEPRLRAFRFDGPLQFDFRGFAERPRLGVQVETLTPQLADYFGAEAGVLVAAVSEGSPAAEAGIRAGDVITAVNGTAVRGAADLYAALPDAGGEVTLTLLRDKAPATITARLEP